MFAQPILVSLLAVATLTSATPVLKPIADPVHLLSPSLSSRDTKGCKAFDPSSIRSFFWADESAATSKFIANFTLLTPGDHEDIIALKDISDSLKTITCDHTANTISIELLSEDCFGAVENAWKWVNENSDNTFTLVTEAGQCDPDEVRDPYYVTGARFEKSGWKVTFDAKKQPWSEVAHSFRLKTSVLMREQVQSQNTTSNSGGSPTFYDAEMNELFTKAQKLQEDMVQANRSGTADANRMLDTRVAFATAINTAAKKGFEALNKLSQRYGSAVAEIVDSAKKEHDGMKTLVAEKENEVAQNPDTDAQAEWSLHEEVLRLEQHAVAVIETAFAAIYVALGQTPPCTSSTRSLTSIRKRGGIFDDIWDVLKTIAETVINGVATLLGANQPLTIGLESDWTPELFNADHSTEDYGMDLTLKAQLKTGGKIVAEFEVDVDFDEASKVRVHVNPEGVFGSLTLNVTAGGTLTKPLTWEPVKYDLPIPHAGFEIPSLIKIGSFISLSLRAALEKLEGNATLAIGAKATISDDAVVLIDMLNAKNNEVSNWMPEFEAVGPDFDATISGHLSAGFTIGLKLEASILDGKIGAEAELEAQVPRFDVNFEASSSGGDLARNVCGGEEHTAIKLDVEAGVDLKLYAGLVGSLSEFDILDKKWPLFSTCKGIKG
ncbi:hypothetical protein BDV95DRAFT_608110 [Massariosphaeria phaeospora]|uniref:Uncharacterized protein n=1 Tax=Massariosphaeria phaeospora TaxID=100035 RepID=A0A7C8I3R0_9PLEO|nr:hypothetical protein BDV95DRAFT_608110 [Massariosphaeria phaeospora]